MSAPAAGPLRLRLPATSANLGPAFDAAGLAMNLHLTVHAEIASAMAIDASGRDAALIAQTSPNLLLDTYREVAGKDAPALKLRIENKIPLGMGCGSSAAALLAGVSLANHFGGLRWSREQVLLEACRREGHPDNVAACFHGGFTVSALSEEGVTCASFGEHLPWRLLLALPRASLATSAARALLPGQYSRQDTVRNLQSVALLVSAFALGRPELLTEGTRDLIHQPARASSCLLLGRLLPLAGAHGLWSVTLSGAGPSVLLLADPAASLADQQRAIEDGAGDLLAEVVSTTVAGGLSST